MFVKFGEFLIRIDRYMYNREDFVTRSRGDNYEIDSSNSHLFSHNPVDIPFVTWCIYIAILNEIEGKEVLKIPNSPRKWSKMPFLGVLVILVGFILTLVLFEVRADDNYHNAVVTHTIYGFVKGYSIPSHYEAYDTRRVNIFLGIPYARRPDQFMEWKTSFRFQVRCAT